MPLLSFFLVVLYGKRVIKFDEKKKVTIGTVLAAVTREHKGSRSDWIRALSVSSLA
jgi:hypothetical protein